MNILPENKSPCRKLFAVTAVLGLLLYTVCFALARAETVIASDILLADSVWTRLLALLQTVSIVLSFALLYTFTAYVMYHAKPKSTLLFTLTVLGILLFRFLLSLFGKYLDGASPREFFLYVLPLQALHLALEVAQYLLVILIIWLVYKQKCAFSRVLLLISLTIMMINVGSRIFVDIGIGAPNSAKEVFEMVAAYTSDILLYGVLLFFAMKGFARFAKKLENNRE